MMWTLDIDAPPAVRGRLPASWFDEIKVVTAKLNEAAHDRTRYRCLMASEWCDWWKMCGSSPTSIKNVVRIGQGRLRIFYVYIPDMTCDSMSQWHYVAVHVLGVGFSQPWPNCNNVTKK